MVIIIFNHANLLCYIFLKILYLLEIFSEIFAGESLSCVGFDSKQLAGGLHGVQLKWDRLCNSLIEAAYEHMEVIRLWIIIIWFPWLLYEIENVHNKKLKLQRNFGRGLEFKGLIIYSHEHFLLHVNIEMSGKSDLLWRNKSMWPNWTRTYLSHEMRSDWIIALVRNCELTMKKFLSLPELPVTLQFSLYLIVLTFIMACWITTYLCKVSLQNEGSFCWNKKVFGKCYVCFV